MLEITHQNKRPSLPLFQARPGRKLLNRLGGAAVVALGIAALSTTSVFAKESMLPQAAIPPMRALQQEVNAVDSNLGLLVIAVDPNGPAAQAGIVRGDILNQANGAQLDSTATLYGLVSGSAVGDELLLDVQHGDEVKTMPITLGQLGDRAYLGVQVSDPPGAAMAPVPQIIEVAPATAVPAAGADMVTATVEVTGVAVQGGGGQAVAEPVVSGLIVVEVAPDGPAAEAGVVSGDLIMGIDGQPVVTIDDLLNGLKGHTPGEVALLRIHKVSAVAFSTADTPITLGAAPDDPSRAYLGVSVEETTPAQMVEAPPPGDYFTAPALPVAPPMPMPPDAVYSYGYGYAAPAQPLLPYNVPLPAPYAGQVCGAAQPYIYAPGATIMVQPAPAVPAALPAPALPGASFFIYNSGVNPQAYPQVYPSTVSVDAQGNVIWYGAGGESAPVIQPYPGAPIDAVPSTVTGEKHVVVVRKQAEPTWTISVPGVAVGKDVMTASAAPAVSIAVPAPVVSPLPVVGGEREGWY